MSEDVLIALITTGGTIVVALIGLVGLLLRRRIVEIIGRWLGLIISAEDLYGNWTWQSDEEIELDLHADGSFEATNANEVEFVGTWHFGNRRIFLRQTHYCIEDDRWVAGEQVWLDQRITNWAPWRSPAAIYFAYGGVFVRA